MSKVPTAVIPMMGNLAWAALPAADTVEIFDQFNGVPSLGIVRRRTESYLFWRVLGYTSRFSMWIYVPLLDGDEPKLLGDEHPGEPLDGVITRSAVARSVSIGMAADNRLFFEREWMLPPRLSSEQVLRQASVFLAEALTIASEQDLPPARLATLHEASRAVRDLVSC